MHKTIIMNVGGRWFRYPITYKQYSRRIFVYNDNYPIKIELTEIRRFLENN